jgi:hypothetical protein
VAAAGAAGGNGASSTFGTDVVVAVGGTAGSGVGTGSGGAGGLASACTGDTKYNGGDGADGGTGSPTYVGGGGGASAGNSSDGTDGTDGNYYGATAVGGGGPGGDGGVGGYTETGSAPVSGPGGGGGGGAGGIAVGKSGGAGYAGQVKITYTYALPSTPVISAPEEDYISAPGPTLDLTAEATQANGLQVKYRWKYSKDSGADTTIGDTGQVDSGTAENYEWDTITIDTGVYKLKCWSVSSEGDVSMLYDSIVVTLDTIVITAPADESSHVTGTVDLTAKGYLAAAGNLQIQWEIDTASPPSDANDDYDLITSGIVGQGVSVTCVGNIPTLGAWYVRARTKDLSETPVYSDWSDTITIHVLEKLMLDSGSQVGRSILSVANKVYVRAKGTSTTGTAPNTTTAPTYADSPREVYVVAPPEADTTACAAIAAAQLAIRKTEQVNLSGLVLKLEDGMKLNRGDRVGVYIERMGIDGVYPIREMQFDVANDECTITVGDFWEPQTEQDALVAIAQKVQQLEKEAAG